MATPLNLKVLTDKEQKKQVTAANAAMRSLFLSPDGTVWSADTTRGFGQGSNVYRQDAKGTLVTTIAVPNPVRSPMSPERPALSLHGLLVANDNLWISDFTYGMIYRYVVPKDPAPKTAVATIFYEGPAPSPLDPDGAVAQYAALAFQPGATPAAGTLWALDVRGNLVSFDTAATGSVKPSTPIALGVGAQSVESLVYHEKTKSLWMIAKKKGEDWSLVSLSLSAGTPTAANLKFYLLPDAQALALAGDDLYVGGTSGQIWHVKIDAAQLASATLLPDAQPIIVLTRASGTAVSVFGMTVDKEGGVWVSDNTSGGHIYGVTPPRGAKPAGIQTIYQLIAAPASKPANVAYRPAAVGGTAPEALFITDRGMNGQVICISPLPGVLPIDDKGDAAYTLEFQPTTLSAWQKEAFGGNAGFALRAHPKGDATKDLEGDVSLELTARSATVSLGGGTTAIRKTSGTTATPLMIKDLVVSATSSPGDCILKATGQRGKDPRPSAEFRGLVQQKFKSLKFTNGRDRVTEQDQYFSDGPDIVITSDPTSNAPVKVTLAGPKSTSGRPDPATDVAHFNNVSGAFMDIHAGDTLASVKAGKLAGEVTVTLSVDPSPTEALTPMTWHVIPVPTLLSKPSGTNFTLHEAKTSMAQKAFTLTGHERLGDDTSKSVPVEGWKILLTLDDTDLVKFIGTGMRANGKELVLTTDKNGKAIMKATDVDNGTNTESGRARFSITAQAHMHLHGRGETWTLANVVTFTGSTF